MVHVPRPIRDKAEYGNAMEIIQALGGLELNDEQEDYLETLSIMVNDFEDKHLEKLPKATPLEVLKYLVEAKKKSQAENLAAYLVKMNRPAQKSFPASAASLLNARKSSQRVSASGHRLF